MLEVVVPGKVGEGHPKLRRQEEVERDTVRAGLWEGDAKGRGGGNGGEWVVILSRKTLTQN